MECKDENYDPDINLHSEESDPEPNNHKDAVGSPFENREIFNWDGFTHNAIGRGGPQADKPTTDKNKAGGRTQKSGTCICCGANDVLLWHGNRYRCHTSEENVKQHASFCHTCAAGYDEDGDPIQCPKHTMNPYAKKKADTIPLEPVWT